MSAIQLCAEWLAGDGPTADAGRYKKMLAILDRQVSAMGGMVEDILSMALLRADRLTLKVDLVDLCELVRERVELARLRSPERKIRLDGLSRYVITADRVRLGQAVDAILGSALEYSALGTKVRVEVRQRKPEGVTVSIRDRGRGMAPDECEKALNSSTIHRTTPSTALGLACTWRRRCAKA